jgi:hypothetical protein
MREPWFDANSWAWLPGTLLGIFGGLWGSLAGILAPQGKAQPLVLGLSWLLISLSLLMLAAGVMALASGQPYGVWYGLGWPGLLGTLVLAPLLPLVRKRYREAEERLMRDEHPN